MKTLLGLVLTLLCSTVLVTAITTTPTPTTTPSSLLIFLSSKVSSGNLGGLEGADALCQSIAGSPNFIALLPHHSKGIKITDRISNKLKPFVNSKGETVALSAQDLFQTTEGPDFGGLKNPILKFNGDSANIGRVFSASKKNGDLANKNDHSDCDGWTSGNYESPKVKVGYSGHAKLDETFNWISQDSVHCDKTAHFYCVQTLSEEEATVETFTHPASGDKVSFAEGNALEELEVSLTVTNPVPARKSCFGVSTTTNTLKSGWTFNDEICCLAKGYTGPHPTTGETVCVTGCDAKISYPKFFVTQDTGASPSKKCFSECRALI